MHAKRSISIPTTTFEMEPGFMIIAAPDGDEHFAEKLAGAFCSGVLTLANGQELGPVGVAPGVHTKTDDMADMSTHDQLDGFIETWDEVDETFFVEPNSLIIIDHIDTFSPEGAATFDAIRSWAKKHGARVIGIRHN